MLEQPRIAQPGMHWHRLFMSGKLQKTRAATVHRHKGSWRIRALCSRISTSVVDS